LPIGADGEPFNFAEAQTVYQADMLRFMAELVGEGEVGGGGAGRLQAWVMA